MRRIRRAFRDLFSGSGLRRSEGQGTLEYVLIIALVVVVILGLIWLLREQIGQVVEWATETIRQWFEQAQAAPGTS